MTDDRKSTWMDSHEVARLLLKHRNNDVQVLVNGIAVPIANVCYDRDYDMMLIELVEGEEFLIAGLETEADRVARLAAQDAAEAGTIGIVTEHGVTPVTVRPWTPDNLIWPTAPDEPPSFGRAHAKCWCRDDNGDAIEQFGRSRAHDSER